MNKGHIRLGIFVLVGLGLFIWLLYFLGNQQQIFARSITIQAEYRSVGGLQAGSIVRFAGITIGTVEAVRLNSDTTVLVTMEVDEEASRHIKHNSRAYISSDGLMGHKMISISAGSHKAAPVAHGDKIQGVEPIEIDEIMAMLKKTGENAQQISSDLAFISNMVRNGNGIAGRLLTNTTAADKLDETMLALQTTGSNVRSASNDLLLISRGTRRGEGTLGKLLVDEQMADALIQVLDSLKLAGNMVISAGENIQLFSENLNDPDNPLGKLVNDSATAERIEQTISHAQNSASELEAMLTRIRSSRLMNILFGAERATKTKASPAYE